MSQDAIRITYCGGCSARPTAKLAGKLATQDAVSEVQDALTCGSGLGHGRQACSGHSSAMKPRHVRLKPDCASEAA